MIVTCDSLSAHVTLCSPGFSDVSLLALRLKALFRLSPVLSSVPDPGCHVGICTRSPCLSRHQRYSKRKQHMGPSLAWDWLESSPEFEQWPPTGTLVCTERY